MTLLERVADHLHSRHVGFALIGASALAHHGVSRSTLDQDLLVIDPAVLEGAFWSAVGPPVSIDVRRGDSEDPLLGVVRCRQDGERDVDVVVGRHAWEREIVARARAMTAGSTPVVERADLVLLKLYAGGSQDRWDIEQLLASDATGETARIVDERVTTLAPRCRTLWHELRRDPG